MHSLTRSPPETAPPLVAASLSHADAVFLRRLEELVEYLYQPIVSVNSGGVFGFEALLRGHEAMGFATVSALIDRAYAPPIAALSDKILGQKAIARFALVRQHINARLFLNIDNRLIASGQFDADGIRRSLARAAIDPRTLCIEISEASSIGDVLEAKRRLHAIAPECLIAIDDFGIGYSGLRLLYDSQPDLIKIDRFFVAGIPGHQKKKVFLASIVQLAHVLGIKVVAEGIETEAEFRTCREIGCDLAQGYWIARPARELSALASIYSVVADSNSRDRRTRADPATLLRPELDKAPTLSRDETLNGVFDAFRRHPNRSVFAVTNAENQPIGVIQETSLKEFVYSPLGRELLFRRAKDAGIRELISPCTVCDITTELDRILDAVAIRPEAPCVVIVDENGYAGLLQHQQLLRLVSERNLAQARNQNPLTRLPGNVDINEYILSSLADVMCTRIFAYFDFDNFKPFNDSFGFRLGDRAIVLFADLLRRHFADASAFLGHIGGDDFVLGLRPVPGDDVQARVRALIAEFNSDATTFYDPETRAAGVVGGFDRSGIYRQFPLLSVSCGILTLEAGPMPMTLDGVANRLASLKRLAKADASSVAAETISSAASVA